MFEVSGNSLERIQAYIEIEQEPKPTKDGKPPAYWPSSAPNEGLIAVENLVVRYAPELDPVLHGVSFKLRAREKVGLLGRTGSGKSVSSFLPVFTLRRRVRLITIRTTDTGHECE